MLMRSCVLASALLAVLLGGARAVATPLIFTDETSYYAVMGGANLAIEGFDTGPFAVAPDALLFGDLVVDTESENDSASQGDFTLGFAAPIHGMAIDVLPLLGVVSPSSLDASEESVAPFDVVDPTGALPGTSFSSP
jgi:hypothetical protein